jgi:hypothetical protein
MVDCPQNQSLSQKKEEHQSQSEIPPKLIHLLTRCHFLRENTGPHILEFWSSCLLSWMRSMAFVICSWWFTSINYLFALNYLIPGRHYEVHVLYFTFHFAGCQVSKNQNSGKGRGRRLIGRTLVYTNTIINTQDINTSTHQQVNT